MKMKYMKLDERAVTPTYGSSEAAGADLYALDDTIIYSGGTKLIHTGIAVEIPQGYVGLVYARSGLASKRGIAPANKVGVIDSDYRGEIMVSLYNQSENTQNINRGERVAQLVITPYIQVEYELSDALTSTKRDTGGFGSTGK